MNIAAMNTTNPNHDNFLGRSCFPRVRRIDHPLDQWL